MKILALELSSARGSIAWRDRHTEVERHWPNDRRNSGAFFKNLSEIHQQFGVPDTIIVGLGPGSYAGTRIAISAAIGLNCAARRATSVPEGLVGYPSICAIETDELEYCVVGDARRQTFFFARISGNSLEGGPELMSESELRNRIEKEQPPIVATEELPQFDRVVRHFPSARILARLAVDTNRRFVLPPLEPVYLREPHITTPRTS